MSLLLVVAVLVAGAVSAVLRFLLSLWASGRDRVSVRRGFPVAVLVVNAAGSLIAGCAAGAAVAGLLGPDAETIVLVGIAGGLTTFSTLNVETLQLITARRYRTAVLNIVANYAVGLAAVLAGYLASTMVLG
jgi:CrcB protein